MISLKAYNTFGLDTSCSDIVECTTVDSVAQVLRNHPNAYVIGGGSNILLVHDLDRVVLINKLRGIEIKHLAHDKILVKAGAGVIWDDLVDFCVSKSYYGIENLTAIPGSVGAAPMQNIGAYGVELKDVFLELKAMHRETQEIHIFTTQDCQFGYRSSIFKNHLKDQYIITEVSLLLSKEKSLNTSYAPVNMAVEKLSKEASISDVRDIIRDIRWSKLPRPSKLGNAGSFFKNPIISKSLFSDIQKKYPSIPSYPALNGIKVPAGWLIEQAGWKGKKIGETGCHQKQSLVIVNYGEATGEEIYNHAVKVQASIESMFNIELEMEVNIVGGI